MGPETNRATPSYLGKLGGGPLAGRLFVFSLGLFFPRLRRHLGHIELHVCFLCSQRFGNGICRLTVIHLFIFSSIFGQSITFHAAFYLPISVGFLRVGRRVLLLLFSCGCCLAGLVFPRCVLQIQRCSIYSGGDTRRTQTVCSSTDLRYDFSLRACCGIGLAGEEQRVVLNDARKLPEALVNGQSHACCGHLTNDLRGEASRQTQIPRWHRLPFVCIHPSAPNQSGFDEG